MDLIIRTVYKESGLLIGVSWNKKTGNLFCVDVLEDGHHIARIYPKHDHKKKDYTPEKKPNTISPKTLEVEYNPVAESLMSLKEQSKEESLDK